MDKLRSRRARCFELLAASWAGLQDIVSGLLAILAFVVAELLMLAAQIRPEILFAKAAGIKKALVSPAGSLLNVSGGLIRYHKYTIATY